MIWKRLCAGSFPIINPKPTQYFREEYLSFLDKFEVDYNSKYLFEWYDD